MEVRGFREMVIQVKMRLDYQLFLLNTSFQFNNIIIICLFHFYSNDKSSRLLYISFILKYILLLSKSYTYKQK